MNDIFRIRNVDLETLEAERARTLDLIAGVVPADQIHEVGSTAVDGLIGKQDLDFLVRVDACDFLRTRDELDQRLQRNPHQLSNDVYQGYTVESPLDVAIQLTVAGGGYDTFLTFLARLRGSASLRAEYNQLKRRFDGRSMSEYREAKRAFIERVLASH